MSDLSPQLARLFQLISQLRIPADVSTNPQSAADLQRALNEIESNADPATPGLEEIFVAANQAIHFLTKQINNASLVSAGDVGKLTVPLNDVWMSYWAEQDLLRMSSALGYPGTATQFLQVIQNINDRPNPLPFLPVPPQPPIPPGPTPTPGPTPPGPTPPGPTPPGPGPNPVPPTAQMNLVAAVQDLYPGSGEPANSAAIRTTLNVSAVYVPVLAYMSDVHSTEVKWLDANNDPVIINGAIDQVCETYQANGLQVILALVLNSADQQPKHLIKPNDPVLFLTNLQSLAIQLATCAVRNGCAAISIAPGVFPYRGDGDAPVNYMPQWRALYAGCKAIFGAAVLYQATPATVGPKGNAAAMDWGSGSTQIWDAIGVEISAPFGQAVDPSNIQSYWETAIDPESPYGLPLWGDNGWLRKLYNDWKSTGRKLWLTTTGITATGSLPAPIPVANVPQPTPVPPGPTPPGPTPPGPTPPGPTPQPPPIHALTPGYMHTFGSQILDINNQAVRISAITWDGMHLRNGFPRGLDIVNYQVTIEDMARLGFNAIRILLNDASVMNNDLITGINTTINPDLTGLAYMEVLDALIAYAGFVGMRIILDSHSSEGIALPDAKGQGNGLWFSTGNGTDGTDGSGTTGTITSAIFTQHWTRIANRYDNNPAILAYDLRWAPKSVQGVQTGVTWGDNTPTDLHAMYVAVGNAIQAIDTGPLLICEAPINTTSGAYEGDLRVASTLPVSLSTQNKVVYGIQSFPNEVANMGVGLDNGTTYINRANTMWGFMASNNIAPVMIVECGDAMMTSGATTWGNTFVQYINGAATGGPRFLTGQQPFGWAWCYWGPHRGSSPDFGVVSAWGGGSLYPEQSAYLSQLYNITPTPVPTPPPVVPPDTGPPPPPTVSPNSTIIPPATQIVSSDFTIWALAGGRVTINGTPDIAAVELVYLNGHVYAENSAGQWFVKTLISDSWTSVADPFLTASSNGTTIPPATQIIGSDLSTWTLTNSRVSVNGSVDPSSGTTVISMAYVNNQVWRQSSATILSTSTYITPNVGSIVFGGHTYTIDSALNFRMDGTIISGGDNTGAVDLYQNTIYGQDNSTKFWFTWNVSNQTFSGPVTAPANLPQGVLWYFKNVPTDTWQPTGGTTVSPLGLIPGPPVQPPSGPNATFNLTSPTGPVVSPFFYGVACNNMNISRADYALMLDPAYQAICKSMNIGSIRLNWNDTFMMTQIFPNRTAAADWQWIDNFINNAQKCFDIGTTLATANLIITMGYCSWLNITNPSDWAVHQNRAQQVAQHFKNLNLPCFYWTFANEVDGTDINSCIGLFNGMKTGIKAVDPNYRVGGLDDSWFNTQRLTPFIQQCSPDFISGHGYTEENGDKSVAQCFADELTDTFVDMRQYVTQNIGPTAGLFLTEYNMDGIPGASSYQRDVTGAVYAAFRYATIGNQGTLNWANRWDIAYDQHYGLIDSATFGQGPYFLRPPGYVYQKLGKLAPGNVISSSTSSGMNMVTMGTVSGNSSCCQIINYDVSTNYPISVVMNGSATSAWTYWELSAAHPTGFTTTISTTALLAGITIPAMSVVVLNAVGAGPTPTPTVGLPTIPGTPVIGSTTNRSVTISWTASTDGTIAPPPPALPPPVAPSFARYVDSGLTNLTVEFDYTDDDTGITFFPVLYWQSDGQIVNQIYPGTELAARQGSTNTWRQVMTGLLPDTEYTVLIYANRLSTGEQVFSPFPPRWFSTGLYHGTVGSQTVLFGSSSFTDDKLNIVICGEGFTSAEQTTFNTLANTAAFAILNEPAYWNYQSNINIVRLNLNSNQSGLPTTNTAQNFFGTWQQNSAPIISLYKVMQKVRQIVPNTTLSITVANADLGTSFAFIGLPSGEIITAGFNTAYQSVVVHESGHAIGTLGDEYGGDDTRRHYTGAEPTVVNLTTSTNRSTIPWANMISPSTAIPTVINPNACVSTLIADASTPDIVGLFEGGIGYNCNVWHPQAICRMNYGGAYCAVCEESVVQSFRTITGFAAPATPAPFSLTWSAHTSSSITFTWSTNSSFSYDQFKVFVAKYLDAYVIYTATSPTQVSSNNWQLVVTGLASNTRYLFAVEGHTSAGWSRVNYGTNQGYVTL